MSQEETPQALTQLTKEIRRIWHKGEWYYSVVDIIAVLTDSTNPNTYWRVLKTRAKTEGFEETLAQIEQLKLKSPDGRFRLTDTANRQTLLRLIQSVPSPKAEPVRLWLAQVGEERIEEIEHPEAALDRVRARPHAKGYDDSWIEERIKNDLIRNELTDEWRDRGAQEGIEFAILTNELSKGTFGIAIQAHKQYKLLPAKANLRDHMTPLELALSSLSEATAMTTPTARAFPNSNAMPPMRARRQVRLASWWKRPSGNRSSAARITCISRRATEQESDWLIQPVHPHRQSASHQCLPRLDTRGSNHRSLMKESLKSEHHAYAWTSPRSWARSGSGSRVRLPSQSQQHESRRRRSRKQRDNQRRRKPYEW